MTAPVQGCGFAKHRTDNFVFSPVRGRNRAKSLALVPGGQSRNSMGMTRAPFHTIHRRISEIEFLAWAGHALPGDVLEYHRGFLALDGHPQGTQLAECDRAALARLAREAWRAAELGLVHLVQRRHGDNDYAYLAIARPKPKDAFPSAILLKEAA